MGSGAQTGHRSDELQSPCHLQHFVQREKISSDEGSSLKRLDADSCKMKDTQLL